MHKRCTKHAHGNVRILVFGAALMLAACAPDRAQTTDPIAFVLDPGGVQLTDSDLRIDFGRTDHSTTPAMTRLVGRGPTGQIKCNDGAFGVQWPDGTTLVFQNGDFKGWASTRDGRSAGLACL